MSEKIDLEEYDDAWKSTLDCVEGMKTKLSHLKNLIPEMLKEPAGRFEEEEE